MFSNTSHNIAYNTVTGILSAECATDDGSKRVTSWLNLNNCLALRGSAIVPFEGPGRYSGDAPLVDFKEDHHHRTVWLDKTVISLKEEWEGNDSSTGWHMLWYGNRWNGKWRETTYSCDLDKYVRNNDGLLEFVAPDREPSTVMKWITWALNKLPPPATPVVVLSIATKDKAAKDAYAERSKNHEEWLKITRVEGENRVVPGVKIAP